MENKYYIPTIQEIIYQLTNIGELYGLNEKDKLLKFQTHPDIVNTLIKFIHMNDVEAEKDGFKYSINPEFYRVKYLDSEDIVECGFKRSVYRTFGKAFYTRYEKPIDSDIIQLFHYEDKGIICITIPDFCRSKDESGSYRRRVLFEGKIKNKSELRKILEMLEIK